MTEPNLATWLLEGGLSRIAENLARVMTRVEVLEAAACPVFGNGDAYLESIGNAIDDDLGWDSDEAREGGDYPARIRQAAAELRELRATNADTPCSCDESVRLRAELTEVQGLMVAAISQRDELRAEVERLKAVADAAREYVTRAAQSCYDDPPMDALDVIEKALAAL